jgi:hypothetical protein
VLPIVLIVRFRLGAVLLCLLTVGHCLMHFLMSDILKFFFITSAEIAEIDPFSEGFTAHI